MMSVPERKFGYAVFVLIVSTVLLAFTAKIDGAQWVDLIKWIGVGYFLANAASKYGNKE
jgi:hypothetical protein